MEREEIADPENVSPESAAAALQETERLTSEVAAVKVPAWYFPALGAVVAPYGLVFLISETPAGFGGLLGGIAVFLVAIALIAHYGVRQMGILRWLTWRETWPVFVPSGAVLIAGLVANGITDSPWTWVATFAVMGAIIAAFGPYHRSTSPYYRQSASETR